MSLRRDAFEEVRRITDQIRADVANPALRFLARCEGAQVGILGNCLLCEADQGVSSPLCVRECAKPAGMERSDISAGVPSPAQRYGKDS